MMVTWIKVTTEGHHLGIFKSMLTGQGLFVRSWDEGYPGIYFMNTWEIEFANYQEDI